MSLEKMPSKPKMPTIHTLIWWNFVIFSWDTLSWQLVLRPLQTKSLQFIAMAVPTHLAAHVKQQLKKQHGWYADVAIFMWHYETKECSVQGALIYLETSVERSLTHSVRTIQDDWHLIGVALSRICNLGSNRLHLLGLLIWNVTTHWWAVPDDLSVGLCAHSSTLQIPLKSCLRCECLACRALSLTSVRFLFEIWGVDLSLELGPYNSNLLALS